MEQKLPICVVIEDVGDEANMLANKLRERGFEPRVFEDGDHFFAELPDYNFVAATVDLQLGGTKEGKDVLLEIGQRWPTALVVIISAHLPKDMRLLKTITEARRFPWYYVPKGDPGQVGRAFDMAVETIANYWGCITEARDIGGFVLDEETQKLHDLVPTLAVDDGPVLILGETGAGKERFAERIHEECKEIKQNRSDSAFRVANCAAWTETLLKSELFGHVKGSFSDAKHNRLGLFLEASGVHATEEDTTSYVEWIESGNVLVPVVPDPDESADENEVLVRMGRRYRIVDRENEGVYYTVLANGEKRGNEEGSATPGTLFLDEVGELSPGAQASLLRVLDGRGLKPVGYDGLPFLPNVRIIAATNRIRNIREDVGSKKDQFREDLYWRLARWVIKVPPVRSDELVEKKAQWLAEKRKMQYGGDAVNELCKQKRWRGNWREIDHVILRALTLAEAAKRDKVCAADVERARAFALEEESAEESSALQMELIGLIRTVASGAVFSIPDGNYVAFFDEYTTKKQSQAVVAWLYKNQSSWRKVVLCLGLGEQASRNFEGHARRKFDVTKQKIEAGEFDDLIRQIIDPILAG